MIVGKIIGGLGNQMFQYAFYKYLSNLKFEELQLDLSCFCSYSLHQGYELEKVFGINVNSSNAINIRKRKTNFPLLFNIENRLLSKNYFFKSSHYKESRFFIDSMIFNDREVDFYVEGYFQNDKYISKIIKGDCSLFNFRTEMNSIEESLLSQESVAIHIRGGDYINNNKDKALFGEICNIAYYKKSIQTIQSLVKRPHFIVFSDDEEYAKNLLAENEFTLIDWNKGVNSYRDMFLMSQCKHNIIANSSSSWWGAYLNKNKNKIVIAPKKWFNDSRYNQSDIIPRRWIKN